ncbi:hypothetical protein [Streptomyces chartreusis]|uniref:hypothetical protein n=1 Tax=Streptomyces chartreusis TaxID=1969 RepID=UPI003625F3E7
MSAGGRLTDRIRTRCLYTGESPRWLKGSLTRLDNLRPIPDADESQALLESRVMEHLAHGGAYFAHPFGIARTRITSDGETIVHLDDRTVSESGDQHPMSTYALDCLLPTRGKGIYVPRADDLRMTVIRNTDLGLTRNGVRTLVLRRTAGTRWRSELADRESPLRETDDDSLTISMGSRLTWHWERLDLAWLGSGLLRRIALFHTSSSAYRVTSWRQRREWIFELDTRRDVPLGHDVLLERLMDRVWGLPLRIQRASCTCGNDGSRAEGTMKSCVFCLVHTGDRVGVLQLRFRSVPGAAGDRATLQRVSADPAWLDRVLPAQGESSALEVPA